MMKYVVDEVERLKALFEEKNAHVCACRDAAKDEAKAAAAECAAAAEKAAAAESKLASALADAEVRCQRKCFELMRKSSNAPLICSLSHLLGGSDGVCARACSNSAVP